MPRPAGPRRVERGSEPEAVIPSGCDQPAGGRRCEAAEQRGGGERAGGEHELGAREAAQRARGSRLPRARFGACCRAAIAPIASRRAILATTPRPYPVEARSRHDVSSSTARAVPVTATATNPAAATSEKRRTAATLAVLGAPRRPSNSAASPPIQIPAAAKWTDCRATDSQCGHVPVAACPAETCTTIAASAASAAPPIAARRLRPDARRARSSAAPAAPTRRRARRGRVRPRCATARRQTHRRCGAEPRRGERARRRTAASRRLRAADPQPAVPPNRATAATPAPMSATSPSRNAQRATISSREATAFVLPVVAATPVGTTPTPNANAPAVACPSIAETTRQFTV